MAITRHVLKLAESGAVCVCVSVQAQHKNNMPTDDVQHYENYTKGTCKTTLDSLEIILQKNFVFTLESCSPNLQVVRKLYDHMTVSYSYKNYVGWHNLTIYRHTFNFKGTSVGTCHIEMMVLLPDEDPCCVLEATVNVVND